MRFGKKVRDKIEENAMVVVKTIARIVSTNKLILINHEYEENIGTIYKGSIYESNKRFRFRERFRKKHGVFWCDSSFCMEAI